MPIWLQALLLLLLCGKFQAERTPPTPPNSYRAKRFVAPPPQKNYYAVLGLEKTASKSQILDAFRRLSVERDPEMTGSDEAINELVDAFDVLSDDENRKVYDKTLLTPQPPPPPPPLPPPPPSMDEDDDDFDVFPRPPRNRPPEHKTPQNKPPERKTTQASTQGPSSKKPTVKFQRTADAMPALSSPDYYKVLGIPRNAGPAQINTAYWSLEEKLDPRIGGSVEQYKLLGEAFEVLSNEGKKKRYDQTLKMAASSTPADEPAPPPQTPPRRTPQGPSPEPAPPPQTPPRRTPQGPSPEPAPPPQTPPRRTPQGPSPAEEKEAATDTAPQGRGGSGESTKERKTTTDDTPGTCRSFGFRIAQHMCKCKLKEYSCYMKTNDPKKRRGCGEGHVDRFADSCQDCYCARDLALDHRCCHDEAADTYTWIPDTQLQKQMMGLRKSTCPYSDDQNGKRRKMKHAEDYLCDK